MLSGDELLEDEEDIMDNALLTAVDGGVILLASLDGSIAELIILFALSLIIGALGGLNQS